MHLEVDENSHQSREISCELKKADSAAWGVDPTLAHRPTVMVRFNPGVYDVRSVSLEERCRVLVSELKELFVCDLSDFSKLGMNFIFMYYHTRAQGYINAAREASGSLKVLKCIE